MSSLNVTAAISFIKGGVTFYSNPLLAVQALQLSVPLEVDGKAAIHNIQTIGTSDETLDKGDIGTIGYIYLSNLSTSLVSTPGTPVVTPINTGGSQTWTYKIVAFVDTNRHTVASAAGSTAVGNATIDETNYNLIKWLPVDGAQSYDVYRTVSGGTPSTTGFIANVLSSTTFVSSVDGLTYMFFNDTALVGDGSAAPSTTPWDYKIIVGSDGSSYPMKVRGTGIMAVEWNAAAIHAKASFNAAELEYLLIEA